MDERQVQTGKVTQIHAYGKFGVADDLIYMSWEETGIPEGNPHANAKQRGPGQLAEPPHYKTTVQTAAPLRHPIKKQNSSNAMPPHMQTC